MKKGYNWKGRQVVQVDIDNSKKNKLEVDIPETSHYDKSNEFILPDKKRKTKVKDNRPKITKILSKKHRKRLEKVVDRKKKKANRASLLESLSKVQASPLELQQLVSISSVQTKGLKKHFLEQQYPNKNLPKSRVDDSLGDNNYVLNSLQGSKRKRLDALDGNEKRSKISSDPNVVGLEESDSEEIDSEHDEKDTNEEIKLEDDSETNQNQILEPTTSEAKSADLILDESEAVQNMERIAEESKLCKEKEKTKPSKKVTVPSKPATYVDVIRTPEIQEARLKLPILAEEQLIMETISENDVVILAGETGSGKTTQVPQFLYEAGYAQSQSSNSGGMIGITEPRRMAAIAMSKRVAHEMTLGPDRVSYLIRFEGNTTDSTQIKFMTDGVLLKEIQTDFLLNKYSVIILDEAHERSVYTDILIGLLSRIVPLRRKRAHPLKLIVMSATLRLSDFTENRRLFKVAPPVVKVDARQWPVTIHFNKRTPDDYVREAYAKACKVHNKLPDGGMLIFVTGQSEVTTLVRKLRSTFPYSTPTTSTNQLQQHSRTKSRRSKAPKRQQRLTVPATVNLDDYSLPGDMGDDDDDVELELSDGDDEAVDRLGGVVIVDRSRPLWVLPLFSMLDGLQQGRVFEAVPEGCRLCVVSTNVAETSLTIPGIRYVIDTGRTKRRLYDPVTGVSQYAVTWCSKAAAEQRAGRAGRTAPGHCYRLYSSAVYNDQFRQFARPEIQEKPVDDLYLQMRCMGVDRVVNFPFPSAPDLLQLKTAETRLGILGALAFPIVDGIVSEVTPLGQAIARFPLLPRFGKMLALSHQFNLLPYTICLVAALSVQEVLLETPIGGGGEGDNAIRDRWRQIRQQWAGVGHSLMLGDAMVLLKAVGGAEYANSQNKLEKFCSENGLRQKALLEIRKLRLQLTGEVKMNVPDANVNVDPQLPPPSDLQTKLLRQILLAGLGDQVARKIPLAEVRHLSPTERAQFKYAYRASGMEGVVHMRRGCVLRRTLPDYVVFQEMYEVANVASGEGDSGKMYMRGVTAVEVEWLPTYVPALCSLGEPLEEPPPRFCKSSGKVLCTVNGTFGPQAWPISAVELHLPATHSDRYKWFARFLLEGAVFTPLARFTANLLSLPTTIVKDWAKLQPRVLTLVKCLTAHDVRTKGRLEAVWEEDKKFLLPEYLKWLPASAHEEVKLIWPPTNK